MSNKPFLVQFQGVILSMGHKSITKFLNAWIQDGGSFRSLHEWVTEIGIHVHYFTLWIALRKYLTIPYDYEDQYWYRWNKRAKEKGYESIIDMLNKLSKTDTTAQIAKKLHTTQRNVLYIMDRVLEKQNKKRPRPRGKKYRLRANKDGFHQENRRLYWIGKVRKKGFNSIRTYIRNRRLIQRMTWKEIAKELGIHETALRVRLNKAGIEHKAYPRGTNL